MGVPGRVGAASLHGTLQLVEQSRPVWGGQEAHEAVRCRRGQVAGQVVGAHSSGGHQLVGEQRKAAVGETVTAGHGQDGSLLTAQLLLGQLDLGPGLAGHPDGELPVPEVGCEFQHGESVGTGHGLSRHLRLVLPAQDRLDHHVAERPSATGMDDLDANLQGFCVTEHCDSSAPVRTVRSQPSHSARPPRTRLRQLSARRISGRLPGVVLTATWPEAGMHLSSVHA